MSFADIHARRQAKEAKSLVGSSKAGGDTDAATEAPAPLYETTLPSSVDVRSNPERGRGIYAKGPLKKGDQGYYRCDCAHLLVGGIVFGIKPPIYVLPTKNLEHFCSSCIAPAPASGLKRCTLCKNLWYCNAVRLSLSSVSIVYRGRRHRHARATIGRSIRKNATRCGDGQPGLHLRTSLYPQSP